MKMIPFVGIPGEGDFKFHWFRFYTKICLYILSIPIIMEQYNEVNYESDETGFPTLFSTNLFLMAKQILPFRKTGLNDMIQAMEEKRKWYKKD